ncbi:MAG TPA: type IX secretion system membrane protein PorP/SprF, partial [Bacteroidetes bacterium]|nr:type IX secretion system membrane protein PorP/SprF [Bacteroidota bacterium]
FVSSSNLNGLYLGHQQRQLSAFGWKTISQFINFKSKALGKARNFGWGAYLYNDIEHSERRTALGASVGVGLIRTEFAFLSIGFSGGLINWGSNYTDIPVYHPSDPLVARISNIAELDAGIGFSFGYSNYTFRTSANAMIQQLPGTVLSDGIRLFPHALASANFLMSPITDIYIGPMVFYRNTFTRDSSVAGIQAAELDVGFRVDFDRPNFWFGAAYRMDKAALTAIFGLQIAGTDTNTAGRTAASFMDINLAASYPMNGSSIFGPSVELGLSFQLGRAGEDIAKVDTIGQMRGSFWVSNGNMNMHKVRHLAPTGPKVLMAQTRVEEERVMLSYIWDDNQYQYVGTNLDTLNDSLIRGLGTDWVGIDNILENMAREVIPEALVPVNKEVENPDSLEPLKDLITVGLAAQLKFDEVSADFGADNGNEGVVYGGELGYDAPFADSLSITVKYFGLDTVVVVKKGERVTNLELSCLKLEAMQRKLLYELQRRHGEKIAFVREGVLPLETGDKKIAYLRTPEVIPDNPNFKPFQKSVVRLEFIRDPNWEPIITASSRKRKKGKGQKRREVRGKRARNEYRAPVRNSGDK